MTKGKGVQKEKVYKRKRCTKGKGVQKEKGKVKIKKRKKKEGSVLPWALGFGLWA
jgi:hypothetical protein